MALSEPGQPRTRTIDHRGQQIMLLDYSQLLDSDQALREIEKSKVVIASHPPGSLRTLTYVQGSRYTVAVVDALKDLVAHNNPYVKAAAVVGMNTLHRVIFRAVVAFSRRNIHVFDDLDQAKDWLVEQG